MWFFSAMVGVFWSICYRWMWPLKVLDIRVSLFGEKAMFRMLVSWVGMTLCSWFDG